MRVWLLVSALVLAGCATPARPPAAPDTVSGRLSVRVETQPVKTLNSAFELRGSAERGELDLTTPLGTTIAQARWSNASAELRTSDGTQHFADLDALAHEALGEALPLAALFDWLRGRPWGGAPSAPSAGGFEQLGWRVDLERFGEGWVVATRSAAPAVAVRARLETAR